MADHGRPIPHTAVDFFSGRYVLLDARVQPAAVRCDVQGYHQVGYDTVTLTLAIPGPPVASKHVAFHRDGDSWVCPELGLGCSDAMLQAAVKAALRPRGREA